MKHAFLGLILLFSSPAWALKPIHHYHDLVAGQGCAGYRDGEFATALFNHPLGLALGGDGSLLFVADENNNRIRVIHLDEDNRVETVAGSGQEGALDGDPLKASFNHPAGLLFLSPDKLLVNDRGNRLLRIVDLGKKEVTTVAGSLKAGSKREGPALEVNLDPIWNMVYQSSENSVYFSEPGINLLGKWDLSSGMISLPLGPNPVLTIPMALCVFQNHVCVSDGGPQNQVYLLDSTGNTLPGQAALSARLLGAGKGVVALAALKDDLYGLQTTNSNVASAEPIVKLNPYRPVHLYSPFAFPMDIQDDFAMPLLNFDNADPPGFVADTQEERKFYVASSSLESVIDFRDYSFEHLFSGDTDEGPKGLTDFAYPETKPPQTFRILIVGNSLPTWSHEVNNNHSLESKRLLSFPKKLELFLNTQAALDDLPVHFEVLVYRHKYAGSLSLYTWPYYEVPEAARIFDADLTLFFSTSQSLIYYESIFERPSTSEGVVAKDFDPEYLLKPEKVRFSDPFVKPFYEKAVQRGLLKLAPAGQKTKFPDGGVLLKDEQTRVELERVMAKPLGLLRKKMDQETAQDGHPRDFIICYAPGGMDIGCPEEMVRLYWKDISVQAGIPMMDLTAPFEALKPTYSPTYENVMNNHFNVYGSELMALILTHELLKSPWADYWKKAAATSQGKVAPSKTHVGK